MGADDGRSRYQGIPGPGPRSRPIAMQAANAPSLRNFDANPSNDETQKHSQERKSPSGPAYAIEGVAARPNRFPSSAPIAKGSKRGGIPVVVVICFGPPVCIVFGAVHRLEFIMI